MKKAAICYLFLLTGLCAWSQSPVCVSGDCINGKGRLRVPKFENKEFEGEFENSKLSKGKVYHADGSLWYAGDLHNFIRSSEGITYAKDAAGRQYVLENGGYSKDTLVNGSRFNAEGKLLSFGSYKYDGSGRMMLRGQRLISYRGKTATQWADDNTYYYVTGNPVFEGRVLVREGEDPEKGRYLSEARYKSGVRHGKAREWDYDNDLLYVLFYDNGKLVADSNRITQPSTRKLLASNVRYVSVEGDDFIADIASGTFFFDGTEKVLAKLPSGKGTMAMYRQLYANYNPFDYSIGADGTVRRKTAADVAALNSQVSRAVSANGSSGSASGSGGKLFPDEAKRVKEIDNFIRTECVNFEKEATFLRKYTTRKSYYDDDKKLDAMKKKLLVEVDQFLSYYKHSVPQWAINSLETVRRKIANTELQGFLNVGGN